MVNPQLLQGNGSHRGQEAAMRSPFTKRTPHPDAKTRLSICDFDLRVFFPSNFDQLFAHTPADTARVMLKGSTAVCLHQLWGQEQGLKF